MKKPFNAEIHFSVNELTGREKKILRGESTDITTLLILQFIEIPHFFDAVKEAVNTFEKHKEKLLKDYEKDMPKDARFPIQEMGNYVIGTNLKKGGKK